MIQKKGLEGMPQTKSLEGMPMSEKKSLEGMTYILKKSLGYIPLTQKDRECITTQGDTRVT